MSTAQRQYRAIGDDGWKRTDKVNAELFTLTYGALVVQLIKVSCSVNAPEIKLMVQDYEDYGEVNKQLDKMQVLFLGLQYFTASAHTYRGYNIGTRLIEDFLARSGLGRCPTFTDTAEVISKVAFKTFLNISPTVSFPPPSSAPADPNLPQPSEFILTFEENPLAEFAELPRDAREGGLWFSNVLCGVIRGALEMVEAHFISDVLRGDETTELHVRLVRLLEEEQPENDE